jgi:hypothetical protein
MRFAKAASTDEALRTAYASRAAPPDSMSTTNEPARYSCSRAEVMIEIPANRSEPNSRRKTLIARPMSKGTPPNASVAISGKS